MAHAIQHGSLMIEAGGQVIYIDPAQGNYDGRPEANIILITDIHGDHLAPNVINKLRKAGRSLTLLGVGGGGGTVIIASEAVAKKRVFGEHRARGLFQRPLSTNGCHHGAECNPSNDIRKIPHAASRTFPDGSARI